TVELFVVGIGDGIEPGLVLRSRNGLRITTEVGAGHGNAVCLGTRGERPQTLTKLVVRGSRRRVAFSDCDQAVGDGLDARAIDREAKGCVGANKHLVATFKKRAKRSYLAPVVVTGRVA